MTALRKILKEDSLWINTLSFFCPWSTILRDLACSPAGSVLPPTIESEKQARFYRMVEYYGMSLGLYPVGVFQVQSGGKTILVAGAPDYQVKSDELTTYCLLPVSNLHSRQIQSFEVTLGNCSTAQIGWVHPGYRERLLRPGQNGQGAGYGKYSIAFDCGRSGIVSKEDYKHEYTQVANASVKQGNVIRCESQGHAWSINGDLVASTTPNQEGTVVLTHPGNLNGLVPCLTVKGSVRITSIEFKF